MIWSFAFVLFGLLFSLSRMRFFRTSSKRVRIARIVLMIAPLWLAGCPAPRENPRRVEARLTTPMLLFQKMGDRFQQAPVFTNSAGAEILRRGYPPPPVSNPAADTPELQEKFAQSISNPKLWRTLDREFRFGSVYLGGSPSEYRPLLKYLQKSPDWVIFHMDHLGVAFVRQPAEAWKPEDLDAIRAMFSGDRRNDQVAFLSSSAAILVELDELEHAERYIKEALELNPNRPDAHTGAAILSARREKWEEAIQSADAALKSDKNSVPARYVKAQALFALERYNESWEISTRLAEERPEDPTVLLLHAKASHEAGDIEAEIAALRRLIDLVGRASGSVSPYRVYLGQALSANGEPQAALAELEAALAAGDLDPAQKQFASMAAKRLREGLSGAGE
jgi:hypothetical protein